MKKIALVLSASLLSSCGAMPPSSNCGNVISEVELYHELAKDPHFSNGVPPPGKVMRVEKEQCGYRVYVGVGSADSFGGDTYMVDAQGKIIDIIYGY